MLPLAPSGERRPIPFLATESLEDSAAIAPNGRWIAYRSAQHGRFEIYVRELSSQGQAGPGTWQISSGGGWAPRWRRDGQELFFATGSGILAARVRTDGPTFDSEPPRRLFDPALVEEPGTAFEVTRDGQRFLMLVPVKPREPIRVLVNWTVLTMLHSPGDSTRPLRDRALRWEQAGWARCTRPATRGWSGRSPSRSPRKPFGERFRNEALAVAALNHPHICALFDVGPDYLVMEYVEGKRLRGPAPRGRGPAPGRADRGRPRARAPHGIVHRDLKPSNILVTKQGREGPRLRPGQAPAGRGREEDDEPTATDGGSAPGYADGTWPRSRSKAKPADERTDIFAFGLVLYEMLTGRHAFEGNERSRVMAAILEKDPAPVSTLKPAIPPALEQVVLDLPRQGSGRALAIRPRAEARARLGIQAAVGAARRQDAAARWIVGRAGGAPLGARAWPSSTRARSPRDRSPSNSMSPCHRKPGST